jgi:hypothetical protein
MRKLLVLLAAGCSGTSTEPRSNTAAEQSIAADAHASYANHIRTLRAKLRRVGLGHMHIRIEEPFVVVGDGSLASLERSSKTVRWAADKLEQEFFDRRPTKILDIYLFASAESYEEGVETLTGTAPTTPYGFYSPSQGAMFMNISTAAARSSTRSCTRTSRPTSPTRPRGSTRDSARCSSRAPSARAGSSG